MFKNPKQTQYSSTCLWVISILRFVIMIKAITLCLHPVLLCSQINPLKFSTMVQTYRVPTYSCYPKDSWVALVKKLFVGELVYPWRHKTTKADWDRRQRREIRVGGVNRPYEWVGGGRWKANRDSVWKLVWKPFEVRRTCEGKGVSEKWARCFIRSTWRTIMSRRLRA